jgi:hypothetical protein
MGYNAIFEYLALIESLREKCAVLGLDLLEAEHGATATDAAGGCIAHAHINVIPGLGSFSGTFDGNLPRLDLTPPLTSLASTRDSYILMKNERDMAVYEAVGVPSQLIRRAIRRGLGHEDWDWAVFPRLDLVDETINFWKTL